MALSHASVPQERADRANATSPPYLESLDLEQSRVALAEATHRDATAWVLRAALVGITRKQCDAEIQVTPSLTDRRLFELRIEMSPGGSQTSSSLMRVLDEALNGLHALGYRNYCARQSSDGRRLSYRAVLLKAPAKE